MTTVQELPGVQVAQSAMQQWSQSFLLRDIWEVNPIKTVLGLQWLASNWDGYGSPAPSKALIDASIGFIRKIAEVGPEGLLPPNIVPLPGGGIQLDWHIGSRELEIPIFPDRHIEFLTVEDGEPQLEGELNSYNQVRLLLSWLAAGAA